MARRVRNANRGDSRESVSRESIRRETPVSITCERFAHESPQTCDSPFFAPPPRSAIRKEGGFSSGTLKRFARIRAIRANLRIDSRESGNLSSTPLCFSLTVKKLEKDVAVQNSLLEKFSGKFRRCWKILHRLSGSTKCYPCQGLGTFWQRK